MQAKHLYVLKNFENVSLLDTELAVDHISQHSKTTLHRLQVVKLGDKGQEPFCQPTLFPFSLSEVTLVVFFVFLQSD